MRLAFSIEYGGKNWGICICESCSVQSVFPVPSDDELRKLYKSHYTGNPARLKELLNPKYGRLSFPRQWGIIQRLANKKEGKILDFGCGGGHFLDRVSKSWNKFGIDISDEARAIAEQKGITTFNSIENMEHWEGWFDVITMFATIEHLPRPRETVSELSKLLKIGGLFVIMTGDVGSIKAILQGDKWKMYAPPGHLHFFTARSLDSLMEGLGFNKVKSLYTDGGMTRIPFMPLNLLLRIGLEVCFRAPVLKKVPLFDTYYGYYRKGV
jgi:SAM-dependent methyltransferase